LKGKEEGARAGSKANGSGPFFFRRVGLAGNLQELHLENERRVGPDDAAEPLRAVAQGAGDEEPVMAPHRHELKTLGEAGDEALN